MCCWNVNSGAFLRAMFSPLAAVLNDYFAEARLTR